MNDEQLDRLVAQSMVSDTDVHALELTAGEADLMENVMSTTPTTTGIELVTDTGGLEVF